MKKLIKFKLEELSSSTILSDREKRSIVGGEDPSPTECSKADGPTCSGTCYEGLVCKYQILYHPAERWVCTCVNPDPPSGN